MDLLHLLYSWITFNLNMSYLEPNTLPTKSTINSSDSFIVDSGVLETITSSNIDATTFDNGPLSGLKIPIIKAYFNDTIPSNASLTIMPNEPDSITITMSENNSKETAKTMPRIIALGLAGEGIYNFRNDGSDFVKTNFTVYSFSTTAEGLSFLISNPLTGPSEVNNWNGDSLLYLGFSVN